MASSRQRLWLGAALSGLLAVPTSGGTGNLPVAGDGSGYSQFHSITNDFTRFADQTARLPSAQRVSLFRQRFTQLFPGFYEPGEGRSDKDYDATVARALDGFPALRARYQKVERAFPRAYARGLVHFRRQFPDFKLTVPVWFVHSLGQMDGGTRTIHGTENLIFGADVIAQLHERDSIGPLFDHELFHVENGHWFKDCEPSYTVWCSLWQEGGAVYAASVMNPGATDKMLLLESPVPIRAAVDARWSYAICKVAADLDRTDEHTYALYFYANDIPGNIAQRWGYYIGYRLMQRLGNRFTLTQIDHFDRAHARQLVRAEVTAMTEEAGGCSGPRLASSLDQD